MVERTEYRLNRGVEGDRLSTREVRVLELIGEGLTDEEIGQMLFVATSTVKSHKKAMYDKLGVRCAAHAVHKGHLEGYLGSPTVSELRLRVIKEMVQELEKM